VSWIWLLGICYRIDFVYTAFFVHSIFCTQHFLYTAFFVHSIFCTQHFLYTAFFVHSIFCTQHFPSSISATLGLFLHLSPHSYQTFYKS